jgi:glycosyltransferase involved in cell wall biosynthesis
MTEAPEREWAAAERHVAEARSPPNSAASSALSRDESSLARLSAGPLVTVIIPTRDRPALLREALASVRAQTFTNYEILVVVNGPDNPQTPATLEAANAADCVVVRVEREGIGPALNAGVRIARGRWIAFLDDDDLWLPNKLEVQLKVADAAAADLVFCDFSMFDATKSTPHPKLRPPPPLSAKEGLMLIDYGRGCSHALVRRDAILAVGGFDESIAAPDWDLWIRLSWRYQVTWADAYLSALRQHRQNTSKRISWARVALQTLYKSLRTLPPELRHMRLRIVGRMVKVCGKAAEAYFRHTYVLPLRRRLGIKAERASFL